MGACAGKDHFNNSARRLSHQRATRPGLSERLQGAHKSGESLSELGAGTSKERQWENPNYLKNTKQQPFLDGDRV